MRHQRWRTTSALVKRGDGDALHAPQHRSASIRPLSVPLGRSIWLTSPVTTAVRRSRCGEEHLHLLGRGVLRLVEDDEGVVERAPAHEGQRRDLHLRVALERLLHAVKTIRS